MSMLKKPDYIDIDNDGNTTEPMREQYLIGGIVKAITKFAKKFKGKKDIHTPEFKKYMREKLEKEFPDLSKKELDVIMKDLNKPMGEGFPFEEYAEFSKMPKNIKVFKNKGGLLQDNREQYVIGGLSKILSKAASKLKSKKKSTKSNYEDMTYVEARDELDELENELYETYEMARDAGDDSQYFNQISFLQEEIKDVKKVLNKKLDEKAANRKKNNEGGSIDDQMMMVMTPPIESEMDSDMESDEDMEDNYTRFIMEEALTEDEEDMLMSKLEQDEELAMLFDKVIDVAQEFAGSGPVEGPGSGVSDSIPARLSDGEFVFTAKAVEEIGADNLMAMMKEAEAAADERQPAQMGGPIMEKNNNSMPVGVQGSMLDTRKDNEDEEPDYTNPLKQPPIFGSGLKR